MNLNLTTTIKDVVCEDYRTAEVFRRYGIDFCCEAESTIGRICEQTKVDVTRLLADLHSVLTVSGSDMPHVTKWDADFLAEYIVQNHHRYIRSALPSILRNALRIVRLYGNEKPTFVKIAKLFTLIANDLEAHIAEEERVLFPYIKALVRATRGETPRPIARFGTVHGPIRIMQREHQRVLEWMKEIRILSDNYTALLDNCLTCGVLFAELEEFERELHRHIYLEDNVLFPKAIALEGGKPWGSDLYLFL